MITRLLRNLRWAWHTPKHWYERARYGISYRDVWNLDGHYASLFAAGMRQLATTNHGVMQTYVDQAGGDVDAGWELQKIDLIREADAWQKYRDDMFVTHAESQAFLDERFEWMRTHFSGLWD